MRMKGALRLSAATGLALTLGLGAEAPAVAQAASATSNEIPPMPLHSALDQLARNSGIDIVYASNVAEGIQSEGAPAGLPPEKALNRLLHGTGLTYQRNDGAYMILAANTSRPAAPTTGTIETVTVTAEKMSEDIQTVPIAVTAMTQKELTTKQIAGGPDLIKEVPNLTFSKTNFSGYNIEIRGIGTQAISVTTDPAVAVALNGIPFIRNHFFEQEFYDLSSAEVLRGPQGTLYGRNATAGVVNILSAKPTDEFAATASIDFGNYNNRRYEAMINMPIVDDRLDIRVAGEWTKRDGYSLNTDNNTPIDGRDLWSSRVTIGWKPTADIQTYLVWEHFSEDDNRMRTAKQLCETDPGPTSIGGIPVPPAQESAFNLTAATFSQGCLPTSLYSKNAFEVPNGFSLPFISGAGFEGLLNPLIDPYASTTQSTNLRDIQSAINPTYRAKNDTLELNTDWTINPTLLATSQTGFNRDMLWSSEDYNRFDTAPGLFIPGQVNGGAVSPTGVFCDPQLGCSNRLVVQDLSREHAWQFSQEFRLASHYDGPFNFSVGGNYLHYETEEDYFVFANTFTMIALNNVGCGQFPYVPNATNNLYCLKNGRSYDVLPPGEVASIPTESPQYVDPNPITQLDVQGHNYFVSQNPYTLNSYSLFGEAYYQATPDLKFTAGLRANDDEKHFVEIPSRVLVKGYGYPISGVENQGWKEWTGRLVATWTPKLEFTDQTMFYASASRGYKAGGANPPGPVLIDVDTASAGSGQSVNNQFPDHPLTFKPEFITALEAGSKNTLFDDTLTLNTDIFYYIYKNYQISQIVDRSAINLNFDAHIQGAELESTWEPLPGLRFTFAGGFEQSSLDRGSSAIDLIDRTAGTPGWVLMKPSLGQSSNCVFPTYVVVALLEAYPFVNLGEGGDATAACGAAYFAHVDPITLLPYVPNPTVASPTAHGIPAGYIGFDPSTAPNNGEGFAKNLSGNKLPGAPPFTVSFSSEYTLPVSEDWAATLHGDFYWQANSFARVENDRPYDVIHGYSNVNLSLILNNVNGLQVMGYVKNIFNTTAITGDFLNSDDSGLTTNVFLTDPRLFGVRVTKQFDGGDWPGGVRFLPDMFADNDGKTPPLWIELGGDFALLNANQQPYDPPFMTLIPKTLPGLEVEQPPATNFDYETKLNYRPDNSDWVLSAGIRYGKSSNNRHIHKSSPPSAGFQLGSGTVIINPSYAKFVDHVSDETQTHVTVDFMAGKDLGIGSFGGAGTSTLSGGLRFAAFTSTVFEQISADANYHFSKASKYHDVYNGTSKAARSFHGIGPSIAWSGSTPILGNVQDGEIDVDWGANAALLFGRQRVSETHHTSHCQGGSCATPVYAKSGTIKRTRSATVPNFGGFGGISVRYLNAKVSFGYRADEYFSAMDGGQDTAKSFNRGFFGPFANISIGLGG